MHCTNVRGRTVALAAVIGLLFLATAKSFSRQTQEPPPPVIYTAVVDGIIHPVTAEFMTEVMDRADTTGASLIVFTLRTPGGLVDSTRTIVSRMIASRAPVAVLVGPGGARAASAGFILVLAADVAAMSHGTHIGAAHPVSVGGGEQKPNPAMEKKAEEDVAAYARSLAEARGRNVVLAAEAVTASRAFTDVEARQAKPPLVDFIAADAADLVRQLDGVTVRRFDGRTQPLRTQNARIEHMEMTRRQQLLSAIAHPQIAYLLFTLGVLGLTVELWNPGAIAPGVIGGICLLLAFFAFQVLPIDASGLLLVILGLALLVAEIKVPSFGVLGIGGAISVVIGSLMLTDEVPGVIPDRTLVVGAALAVVAVFLFLGRLGLRAQRQPPSTGVDGMLLLPGRALTAIRPGQPGQVAARGEIWTATAPTAIEAGDAVVIVAVDGLVVRVEPVAAPVTGGLPS
jgi:membrane-bound serine protease (ClpP class)